jgi:uncharacterized membrane protein YsdA (DUF1294 family)/cold shock CspA family protein
MSGTRERKAPRYQGRIATWKDDAGFGFIAPNGGGPTVFVHVKSFTSRHVRPAVDDIVTYRLGANEAGKPRAEDVAMAGETAAPPAMRSTGRHALPVALGFLGLMGLSVVSGLAPGRVFGAYIVLSVVAFVIYYFDKEAAQTSRQRTPESTLHMLALAGGWPGALVAQRLLRHKSSKQSFQEVFRATVVINCIALGALLSPPGLRTFGALLGMP